MNRKRMTKARIATESPPPNAAIRGNASGFHDARKYTKRDRAKVRQEEKQKGDVEE